MLDNPLVKKVWPLI